MALQKYQTSKATVNDARYKVKVKVIKVDKKLKLKLKSKYITNDNNTTLMPSVSIKDISGILDL